MSELTKPFPSPSPTETSLARWISSPERPAALAVIDLAAGSREFNAYEHFSPENYRDLVKDFTENPFRFQRRARDALFLISNDETLSERERDEKLSEYFDANVQLTLRLDRSAYPPDPQGVVHEGIPEYLPDGFINLGKQKDLDMQKRTREGILVDKYEFLHKFKDQILNVFKDPDVLQSDYIKRQKKIISYLAATVHTNMPYGRDEQGKPLNNYGKGPVGLSTIEDAVCRHHAMAFQILAQFFGIESRIFSNKVKFFNSNGSWSEPGHHLANIVKLEEDYWIIDPTNPDKVRRRDNSGYDMQVGRIKIDKPPINREVYMGKLPISNREREYTANNVYYWRIKDMPTHRLID